MPAEFLGYRQLIEEPTTMIAAQELIAFVASFLFCDEQL
jgi:hypothetical protein